MKAVNYQGAFKVKVEDVPKPAIEHPDDVIVKVTTAGKSERKIMTSLSLSLLLQAIPVLGTVTQSIRGWSWLTRNMCRIAICGSDLHMVSIFHSVGRLRKTRID